MTYQLHHGNCIDIMPLIERESVDAVICDPPYGLSFMGKDWDHGVPGEHFWREAYRCVKPGAYLLAFGGTRTFHRLAVAIEDAGWEIRDTVMWVYGQGFPKSHDVSKAIDREAGAEREVIGIANNNTQYESSGGFKGGNYANSRKDNAGTRRDQSDSANVITQPATFAAAEWDGWGTALKPAWEPIIVARKPLQGTVAENVQRYGTGAMNIDKCRIETAQDDPNQCHNETQYTETRGMFGTHRKARGEIQGRWPANLIHDGSAEVLAGFPRSDTRPAKSALDGTGSGDGHSPINGWGMKSVAISGYTDTGSAARFFYCAKASKQDRDEGLEGMPLHDPIHGKDNDSGGLSVSNACIPSRNHHPTVKPTALMRYLCRLVTPPNGTILDPFMGSGSTGKAAMLEGFNFIGIDTEIEYVEIAARRIEHACEKVGIVIEQPMMFETQRGIPCPQCYGTGVYTFDESFDDWLAKTSAYGGTHEEWMRLSEANGRACQQCGGIGRIQRETVERPKQLILL